MEAIKEILKKVSEKEKEYMVLYEVHRDIGWEQKYISFNDIDEAKKEYDYANERPRKYINTRLIIPTDISKLHKLSKYAKELNEDE